MKGSVTGERPQGWSAGGNDTVRLVYNAVGPPIIDLNTAYGGNGENAQVIGTSLCKLTCTLDHNTLPGNTSAYTIH